MSEPAEVHTLVAAYAIGAVDDLEATAFERHLAQCPSCREEVRSLRETTTRLADGVAVTPPEGLRLRLLDAVTATPQVRPAGPSRPGSARPTRRTPWLVAAACALLAVLGGGIAVQQNQARQEAQSRVAALEAIVGDPTAKRVSGPAAGGGAVTLVIAGGRAAVVTSALPALPQDRAYQLWIVRPQAITSAGLGPSVDAGAGSWSRLVDGVQVGDTVAISVEPSAGSKQPTTTPVVALTV